jgi:hypothetical protein
MRESNGARRRQLSSKINAAIAFGDPEATLRARLAARKIVCQPLFMLTAGRPLALLHRGPTSRRPIDDWPL